MPPIQLKPHSFFGGTWTQPKLRLGLESIIPELGGDLNALLLVFFRFNSAVLGLLLQCLGQSHCLLIETAHLVSELSEAQVLFSMKIANSEFISRGCL